MAKYWRFYWPLALTGVAMVLAMQFQNGTLARYPNAVQEIAIFALASSTFGFLNAGLNFTSQLSNVFARSPRGHRRSLKFTIAWSLILTIPVVVIAGTALGHTGLELAYGIDALLASQVQAYLALMSPLLVMTGLRMFYNGLLIQARMTGWVTTLNVVFLTVTIVALIAGFVAGIAPVYTLVGAQILAALVHLVLVYGVFKQFYERPDDVDEEEDVTYGALIRFFVPMTTTGVMFAISRPVLYAFVARTPNGLVSIAALRVAFDLSGVFQQAANQFRHFFVTFGLDDLAEKRRFMVVINIGITLIMAALAVTPLANLLFGEVLGVTGDVLVFATEALLVMCLMPTVIIIRNYYHGLLMVRRRTSGMAVGGVLRVVVIYLTVQIAFSFGWLDHIVATLILILGFVAETVVVYVAAANRGVRSTATT